MGAVEGADGGSPPPSRHAGDQDAFPVPRSNVAVERVSVEPSGVHRAVVRCRACGRRAFDVVGVPADVALPAPVWFDRLRVERRCLCGRTSEGQVAARPGQPPPQGPAGAWRCECGHFLASVDAASGRVWVRCRKCRLELQATAAYVMATARTEGLPRAS